MYRILQQNVLERIQQILRVKYDVELAQLAVEQPPKIAFGELALPVAFELAKRLKKAPRVIAAELQAELETLDGVERVEIAGAGYLNIKLDRAAFAARMAQDEHADVGGDGFRLVEHTSINPNKAAHIGHLRNAILGDTFARLLRKDAFKSGYALGVQNYIDNTGVQVADVVVGLTTLEGFRLAEVRALLERLKAAGERVDYYCWDLYARVSKWYEEDAALVAERKKLRLDTLHALEAGGNETSEIAELISMAVLARHLETMERLDIEYDFLPRESEILHLKFWETAFALMKERGVLYLETEGKNKGCWVMKRAENSKAGPSAALGMTDVIDGPDEDAKIIVRSNGTVTYVGKDIAYHLWKFGLLGKDFGYRKFHEYPTHTCWISTVQGEEEHPFFGKAEAIYNVIDSRQNDPQDNVKAALLGMGYTDAAEHYTHLNYEMVALTPRCAADLGYAVSEEDKGRAYIEVSGRKGFGVKADDLLDKLIAAAQAEVDPRHPELSEAERRETATRIAIGALRYFMLKYTRNSVIAFDFRDALSFEGETGPYVQYAVVRAANIFRKAGVTETNALEWLDSEAAQKTAAKEFAGEGGDGLWELWLTAAKLSLVLEQAIAAAEPAYLAKYAFQMAQQFNNF
ncbi:MAG: DALR anticodon-binding domain-containing protein, partial [Acidobacteriaceae bacterium]|nr:DALR anticodon-binding domain-containing protein [Acidobacteriaceae bacterium]